MIRATADDLRMAVAGQWIGGAPEAIAGVGTDTREALAGRLFVALRGERHDAHQFLRDAARAGAVAALVDRKAGSHERPAGLPLLEVGDTRVALGDLARWWRSRFRGRVVGITGSSGKTTTRRLLHAALGAAMRGSASPKSFNNDIGVPLTILGADAADGYLVCEIGMSHPGEIAPLARMAALHMAVITMAGSAHLEGLGSLEAIRHEKASLVDGLHTTGVAVVNGDQPDLVAAVEARLKPGVRLATFGTGSACQWRLVSRVVRQGGGQNVRAREPDGSEAEWSLVLPGDFNAMNALAAYAAARLMGVPREAVTGALATVGPADMRMTPVRIGAMTLVNDAYNANPDAVLASLGAFREITGGDAPSARRVVVLGDMLELGAASAERHAEVGRAVAALGPALAVFVGGASRHGAEACRAAGTEVVHVPALDDAGVAAIAARLRPGDAILLKGSRGSRMERVEAALRALSGSAEAAACSTT